jgi:CubicO group peptidase (beta-lactamase class C family)
MKKILLSFILLLLFFFSSKISFAQNDIQKKMDEMMKKCEIHDLFSGTILIAKDENIIYEKAAGYSDHDKKNPNELDTKFNIGSIGKTFTAVLILQLYENGKLDLTKPINEYLPEYKIPNADKITIHHLLSHNSGLSNYMMHPKYRQMQNKLRSIDEVMKLVVEQPLVFKTPGEKFSYSNSGFIVLGKIIEKITHKKYSEYLKEKILDPLGMKNSGLIYREQNIPKQSIGYTIMFSNKAVDNLDNEPPAFSDGGMYTTIEDMLKYDQALYGNTLLKNETIELMFAGGKENIEKYRSLQFSDFGYGWANPKYYKGKTIVSMTGGTEGVTAEFQRFISDKYTVIILSNYSDGMPNVARSIDSIVLDGKYNLPGMRFNNFLYNTMKEKGLRYFSDNFDSILQQNNYKIRYPQILNNFGYELLAENMYEESIVIFKINTDLFLSMQMVMTVLAKPI